MSLKRSTWAVLMLLLVALLGLPTAAGAQTANGIKTPTDGATVGGIVEVVGYADTLNFQKWQLDLLPADNADRAIWLITGTDPGRFIYPLNTELFPAGQYELRLRVVRRDSNYEEYFTKLTFAPVPKATTTPEPSKPVATPVITATTPITETAATKAAEALQTVNGIKSPKDGATVGGVVVVTGYANSPDFKRWQIDLLPGGKADQAMFLVTDNGAGAFTYHLNTTRFPAGEYQLRLRVVRNDSNYDEYFTKLTFAAEPTKPAITAAEAVKAVKAEVVAQNVNGIVTPKDGDTLNGIVVVAGYANSESFMKWQLDLVSDNIGDLPIFLALGTDPGQFTYNLNTEAFLPGRYWLRLRVVHENSNYDEYTTQVRLGR